MVSDIQLISGIDIPYEEAQIIIHQPTIKEIAYIGEDNFFLGCELLKFSKDRLLNKEDKSNLENYTDFDIFMSIVENKNKDATLVNSVNNAILVLSLIFPNYQVNIKNHMIVLTESNEKEHFINATNFLGFQKIITKIFNIKDDSEYNENYNPSGALAQKIAEKLKKRHAKLAEQNGDGEKISVFNRYISILAVGEGKDMNMLLNYTVYQLFDEFKRFSLKYNYEHYFKAKLAGAKDLKEPDDWMDDIHNKKVQKD